ncbi:hypothetical protein HMPREF2999_08135 [Rothia sp. HMSC066H02]|uniref:hypothetical protein n=1 Tax=Rothia mucilaginosa TaxID=43675 RepID=UPI0008A19E23|nr:hypothetical protein [Rothia mucilaginosa]OFO97568.1 hypothetical protein HMPREF3008_06925 [Rothia sp. HMSC065D09]OFP11516.1 hypothetical protein HMPREF2999_08135 [Rothia sp. HMSC066H02]
MSFEEVLSIIGAAAPPITAIAGIVTAGVKLGAARKDAKKAATTPGAGNTTRKLSVGTINGNGNRVHNTHQQVGNGSAAISGDGNRTTIDNSKHTHNHAPSKKGQASNEDTFGFGIVAVFIAVIATAVFCASWPSINQIGIICWVFCLALTGVLIKKYAQSGTETSTNALMYMLYPGILLAIAAWTWVTLNGSGMYNLSTIRTTIDSYMSSHQQGGYIARFIEAVTATYGLGGFTLLMLNLLAAVFTVLVLVRCYWRILNAACARYRGFELRFPLQEAGVSIILAVMGCVACQPALAEHLISQINK